MKSSKLALYVDPSWKRDGIHTTLLFPFWGNPTSEESLFSKEMHDSYPYDTSFYHITDDITKADMVLPPYRHQWFLRYDPELFKECVGVAQEAKLPLLIDGTGDIEYPIQMPNAYILRIGGYRFEHEEGRIQIPPASDDLLERCKGGQLEYRHKSAAKPVVGFAGWARLSLKQRTKNFFKELPTRVTGIFNRKYFAKIKGVRWRELAVEVLKRSDKVSCNFLLRSSFSGSAKTAEKDLRTLRQELVDVVVESDYGLDVRGDANASSRLYEILSLGRIPVIVDTERILPFANVVDYKKFSLMVDFRDIQNLPERIVEFHDSLTDEQFVSMQKMAREAYVKYFRVDALMPHIIKELAILNALRQ